MSSTAAKAVEMLRSLAWASGLGDCLEHSEFGQLIASRDQAPMDAWFKFDRAPKAQKAALRSKAAHRLWEHPEVMRVIRDRLTTQTRYDEGRKAVSAFFDLTRPEAQGDAEGFRAHLADIVSRQQPKSERLLSEIATVVLIEGMSHARDVMCELLFSDTDNAGSDEPPQSSPQLGAEGAHLGRATAPVSTEIRRLVDDLVALAAGAEEEMPWDAIVETAGLVAECAARGKAQSDDDERLRARLGETLGTMVQDLRPQLEFHEIRDWESWPDAVNRAEPSTLGSLLAAAESLSDALLRYRELSDGPPPSTATAQREVRARQAELESEIGEHAGRLSRGIAAGYASEAQSSEWEPLDVLSESVEDKTIQAVESEDLENPDDQTTALGPSALSEPVATAEATVSEPPEPEAASGEAWLGDSVADRAVVALPDDAPLGAESVADTTTSLPDTAWPGDAQVPEDDAHPTPPDEREEDPLSSAQWRLLADGDLPNAYWLAGGEEAAAAGCAPGWIVRALMLSSRADSDACDEAAELAWIVDRHSQPVAELTRSAGLTEEAAIWLALGATCRPALLAPASRARQWLPELHGRSGSPAASFVAAIQAFDDRRAAPLDLELLNNSVAGRSWEKDAADAAREASKWCETAEQVHINYQPASKALRQIAGPSHEFGGAVRAVARNDASAFKDVERVRNEWFRKKDILLDEVQRLGPRRRKLVGPAANAIRDRFGEIREHLSAWLQAVARGQRLAEKTDWRAEQAERLRSALLDVWAGILDQHLSGRAEDPATPPSVRAAARAAHDALAHLVSLLNGREEMGDATESAAWYDRLRLPLLLLVPCPISDDGALPDELSDEQRMLLLEEIERGTRPERMFRTHLEQKDFLACGILRDAGLLTEGDRDVVEEERNAQTQALARDLDGARAAIEQATVDHVISDEQRSDLYGTLESLQRRTQEARVLRLQTVYEHLQAVEHVIEESKQKRMGSLREDLDDLREQAAALVSTAQKELAGKWVDAAIGALADQRLALAEDYANQAEDAVRGSRTTGRPPSSAEPEVDWFDRYFGAGPRDEPSGRSQLTAWLEHHRESKARDTLAKGDSIDGVDMGRVEGARYAEIQNGLTALLDLKHSSAEADRGRVELPSIGV